MKEVVVNGSFRDEEAMHSIFSDEHPLWLFLLPKHCVAITNDIRSFAHTVFVDVDFSQLSGLVSEEPQMRGLQLQARESRWEGFVLRELHWPERERVVQRVLVTSEAVLFYCVYTVQV